MDVKLYRCPDCGADLKFNPDKQLFCCEYCRGEFTQQQVKVMTQQVNEDKADQQEKEQTEHRVQQQNQNAERSEQQMKEDQEFSENTRLYQCPSCGAEIVADMNTAASFCYYCHNPVILKGRVEGMFKPSKVLPFAFGRDQAVDYFNKWAKTKRYIPNDLISEKQIEKMTGLYVPFWVADAHTRSVLTATGENVRTWKKGNYEYTQTKYYEVVRDIDIEYDGVPADGSKKIEDDLMESIEPFDYKDAKDFDMAYLSGFLADKYDVDKESVYNRICERMFENSKAAILSSCGYDRLVDQNIKNDVNSVKWNYMLLPVWFMTFQYKDKMWEYAINGQTGKLAGELPVNEKKLTLHLILLTIITTIIVLILGYFIGGILL